MLQNVPATRGIGGLKQWVHLRRHCGFRPYLKVDLFYEVDTIELCKICVKMFHKVCTVCIVLHRVVGRVLLGKVCYGFIFVVFGLLAWMNKL